MKKITSTLAVVLAVFSLFYFSDTALAGKAALATAPNSQAVSVSASDMANFQLVDIDGATSVRFDARIAGSSSAYTTLPGLSAVTSTGTYPISASTLQGIFGYNQIEWLVVDNNNSSHFSPLAKVTVKP